MAAAPGELRLIKVPRWLSEQWLKGAPGAVVADLDLQAGVLRLQTNAASTSNGRPSLLRVERRASPELFAFPKLEQGEGDGAEVAVEGGILESLSLRADLQDSAYKNMLQQRAEDGSATAGNRSLLEKRFIHLDSRPDKETVKADGDRSKTLVSGVSAAAAAQPGNELNIATFEEVAAAVESALKATKGRGLTCEELLAMLPGGCSLLHLRDALVALADPKSLRGHELEGATQDAMGASCRRVHSYGYAPCRGRALTGEMLRGIGHQQPQPQQQQQLQQQLQQQQQRAGQTAAAQTLQQAAPGMSLRGPGLPTSSEEAEIRMPLLKRPRR
ncbi:unnamed protein product [Polarella glacialis]|uniref:Uncharacterized protein n=2 Tax=Polarella glacialis TaxID=89957 RepID=A0A813ETB7_POLGL|nr:unnamed protein product [Polarella glacialis]